ncbi:hypothetical protein BMF94_1941 [Rhodotorula taiwanensis]|uniref:Sas10 C-terminal domain-containing protein n=1 Tax=Rhodotorula taiwanensis TaxID=741276 RepID=A0A2S5BDW2_9BASI|nr:hypothetical protein BMF94_1941 [Rhodotorula taiwanensis]
MAKGGNKKNLGARKATQYRAKPIDAEKPFDRSASRTRERRIETFEDTFGSGDEDQFHLNRDKLLLDDPYTSQQRRDGGGLDEPDAIYDLDLPESDSDDDNDDEEEEARPVKERVPRHLREYKRKDDGDLKTQGRFGHEYDPKQDVVFPDSDPDSDADDDDDDDKTLDSNQLSLAGGDDSDSDSGDKKQRRKTASDDDSDLEQDHERWAAGHYHVSRRAPGEADSEDEEALELEEKEARRLQKKMRDRLAGEDYGVVGTLDDGDDDEFEDAGGDADKKGAQERLRLDGEEDDKEKAESMANVAAAAATLTDEESIALLLRTQPETLALVDDFLLTASKLSQVSRDLAEVRRVGDGQGNDHPSLAIMELEHQALTTYLPTLAFYFSLLLQPAPGPNQDLVDKVVQRLSSLRGALATMDELDLTTAEYGANATSSDDDEDDDEDADEQEAVVAPSKRRRVVPPEEMFDLADSDASTQPSDSDDDDDEGEVITESMLDGLDDDELEELMSSLGPGEGADVLMERVRAKQREKGVPVYESGSGSDSGSGGGSEEEDNNDDVEMMDSDAEVANKLTAVQASNGRKQPRAVPTLPTLAPLSASAKTSKSARSSGSAANAAANDYLDPLALTSTDKADKASKRHTLRFHAAQVEQKASKRDARRRGLEGDDDLPRRSKEQARREVLKRQQHGAAKDAEARAKLDDGEFGDDDARDARVVRGEAVDGAAGGGGDDDDDDGYYDLVAAEKSEGRQAKKARYDGARAAEREEILSLAESSVDGPRAATRKILSNRGLTPKRNKLNRNARVKKRHQYDQKQKKLRSMQATYSGGEARTGYEGEKTGISRQNVRSRKLD